MAAERQDTYGDGGVRTDADAARGSGTGAGAGTGSGTDTGSGAGTAERVRPRTLAEAAEALAAAPGEERPLLFTGAGTALDWGAPLTGPCLTVETGGLDRVISHAEGDWTVTAQAGMSLTELQRHLAPAGQWLPLDPPTGSQGATLGGLLAGGDTGPRRLAYGGMGDLVIGATLVTGGGSVVRTGGDVIKNVAGYDLAKLFAGSLGAFGLVAQLTLRVHPLPKATATLAVPSSDAAHALGAARTALRSPLEPAAAEWDGQRLLLRFHGTREGAREKARRAARLPDFQGTVVLTEDEEEAAWQRYASLVRGEDGDTVLRAGTHPARMPALETRLRELAAQHGLLATLLSGAAMGVHTAVLRGGDPAGHAACVTAWRAAVHEAGGTVTLRRRRDGVTDQAEAWGPAPGTAPVLRALKRQLDPGGRCAPGRFAPWF